MTFKHFMDKWFWVIDFAVGTPLFVASFVIGIWYFGEPENRDLARKEKIAVVVICTLGPPIWFWCERFLHHQAGSSARRIRALEKNQESGTTLWAGLLLFLGVCFDVFK